MWEPDASQRAVLDLAEGESAVVVGAPGSGKTTTLVALAADRVGRAGFAADELLVLAASRQAATGLRDRLAARLAAVSTGPLARTAASVAFELATEQARAFGEPAPKLLSGADQDLLIRDLLEGHLADEGGPAWPDHLDGVVRRLPVFRSELRELLMRATEFGVTPDRLRRLGAAAGRPEWVAAADFALEYQAVLATERGEMLDPAELGAAAVQAVAAGRVGDRLARVRLLLVDDLQQATESTLRLLRAFADRGLPIVGFGDPDSASNGFRGGEADAVGGFAERLGRPGLRRIVLDGVHRHGPAIRAVVAEVTARIGAAGEGTQRAARSAVADAPDPVVAIVADSRSALTSSIARELRERHLLDGVPWSRLAVVTRSGGSIPALARALSLARVPTRTLAGGRALRDEVAARALLRIVEVGVGRVALDGAVARELLTGPFGGLDVVGLRRLRVALRVEELAGGGTRHGDDLLADALAAPDRLATIDHALARRADRLARTLARIRESATATAEELLWIAWERSRVAEGWRERALGSGALADEADRALDGVVALFSAARRFAERSPRASAADFLAEVVDAEVPEDTLAPRARDEAVLLATPAGVAGFEFDTVVVAGLQDGQWPNLRLRGSLLGAPRLVEELTGRVAPASPGDERRAVLGDELRLFAVAASRAASRLVLAGIDDEDESVSPLLDVAERGLARAGIDRSLPHRDARRAPLDLRGVTGRLRRSLAASLVPDGRGDARPDREAAAALAVLAREGVEGADPARWRGLDPVSTDAPVWDTADPDVRVPVSPSKIATIDRSSMEWFVGQMAGGASTTASSIGTLVHDVLEHATSSDVDELWAAFEARFGELDFESAWDAERHRRLARRAIEALAVYLDRVAARGGRLVSAERGVELDLAPARLSGTIDRVEDDDGAISIVDLKTGSVPSRSEAAEHPQLAAYQLAFADGALDELLAADRAGDPGADRRLGDVRLLYTKKGTRAAPYTELDQPLLDAAGLEAFRDRVRAVAATMAGPRYDAVPGDDERAPGADVRRVHLPGEVSSD